MFAPTWPESAQSFRGRMIVIREDARGFVNLVGIESPGLTASPAIARFIQKMI
jgi:glycerol-3-phosphate dehydrogenase